MGSHTASGDPSGLVPPGSAGALVGAYLAQQCEALLEVDHALRQGDESVIHAARVATRRARSVLRVFSPLFDRSRAERLDHELRWWATTLGPVRDLQVLQARLDAMLADVDDTLPVGPVKTRIDDELPRDRLEHWALAGEALSSERHQAMLDDLLRWGAHPPWTSEAEHPASVLVPRVRRADRAVVERLRRADRSGDVEDMHRARKAAKRARYAAEVAAPLTGKRAVKDAQRYRKLQELLGEHHDSVVSAELLLRLGAAADATPGENGFAFGLLYQREQQRARETSAKVQRLARHLR